MILNGDCNCEVEQVYLVTDDKSQKDNFKQPTKKES